jgi:hypothetical protein
MSKVGTRARTILDAWREQGADRLNPVRFHFIEVLERRAAGHGGEARRLLDDRLSKLLEAYADDLEIATFNVSHDNGATTPCAPARGALGGLIDHIAHCAAARSDDLAASDAALRPSIFPALEALDEFRKIWSEVRTDSQVRQSLEQVPANAGPLNSGSLVHRSLTLMRELSPGYLQQFLSYVDTLSWMEQMNDGGALSAKEGSQTVGRAKRTRVKAARAP